MGGHENSTENISPAEMLENYQRASSIGRATAESARRARDFIDEIMPMLPHPIFWSPVYPETHPTTYITHLRLGGHHELVLMPHEQRLIRRDEWQISPINVRTESGSAEIYSVTIETILNHKNLWAWDQHVNWRSFVNGNRFDLWGASVTVSPKKIAWELVDDGPYRIRPVLVGINKTLWSLSPDETLPSPRSPFNELCRRAESVFGVSPDIWFPNAQHAFSELLKDTMASYGATRPPAVKAVREGAIR